MSMEVGTQRFMPAASGPAISFDSGGGRRAPVVKLRSSLLAPTPTKRGASECESCPSSIMFFIFILRCWAHSLMGEAFFESHLVPSTQNCHLVDAMQQMSFLCHQFLSGVSVECSLWRA